MTLQGGWHSMKSTIMGVRDWGPSEDQPSDIWTLALNHVQYKKLGLEGCYPKIEDRSCTPTTNFDPSLPISHFIQEIIM